MKNKDLVEKKATGEDSMSADATVPAGGSVKKRLADKKTADVAVKADIDVKEEFDLEEAFGGLFNGTDLSEDFKTKTVTIFESAVNQKVNAATEALAEQFEADLTEQLGVAVDELVEQLDSYLDKIVESWMSDNEVAVESNIKTEVAESLLDGIKDLVSEHSIQLNDEEVDVVAIAESKVQESNDKYNTLFEELVTLREAKEQLELKEAFREVSESLTDTQVDKLSILAEGITYNTISEYATKVEAIKANYFTETTTTAPDGAEYLEEGIEEPATTSMEPSIAGYASALDRYATTK